MKNISNRNLWVDYLRSAITVMVVAHHSSLAYTTFARFDKETYINSTHAIVDTKRWVGLDIFENFNDVFFMSLMFLVGGLFLIKSVNKKGTITFIKDRFYRLFIPFLLLGTGFMLIAYFPSYYVGHNNFDILAYVKDFFGPEKWPVGPPWFIWILFLFNLLFALCQPLFSKLSNNFGTKLSNAKNKPFSFFLFLFCITWILYVPLSYTVGAGKWVGFGPFDFQLSRIFLYFGYFALGILLGNTNFNSEIFSNHSATVKKWWLWLLLSLLVYSTLTAVSEPLKQMLENNLIKEFYAWMIYYVIYAASCTISSIAFITSFRKLANKENKLWNSLSENAYLIYLIHYIFVVWCQFLLLRFDIPAFIKFSLTFILSFFLSWLCSVQLRKIRVIEKYV
ncbi:acyltransferase family protein [Maribellus comscasis]|uniref:Acyltransferase family protein n=1 Tax=Maribellus comscasis TaxID=2681766 RepID=A0A6I6JKK5_9BACT|nr:acyltransferase [Maribellus comscasis]QGY42851.1 acyltransferase family protein [Maribellus comscasis]